MTATLQTSRKTSKRTTKLVNCAKRRQTAIKTFETAPGMPELDTLYGSSVTIKSEPNGTAAMEGVLCRANRQERGLMGGDGAVLEVFEGFPQKNGTIKVCGPQRRLVPTGLLREIFPDRFQN